AAFFNGLLLLVPARRSSDLFDTDALDRLSSWAAPAKERSSTTLAKIAIASKSGSRAIGMVSFLETIGFNSFYLYTPPASLFQGRSEERRVGQSGQLCSGKMN